MCKRLTILLEEDVPVDPRKYGPIVAPVLGLTVLEAKMAVRKGRGIFLENIDEENALGIIAELGHDGIGARAMPSDQLPKLSPPVKVLQLERVEAGLSGRLPSGEPVLIPWEALGVAACGVVARPEYKELFTKSPLKLLPPLHTLDEKEREIVRENLILKLAPPPSEEIRKKDLGKRLPEEAIEEIEKTYGLKVKVYLDLITCDGGTWWRIPMDEVSYAHDPGAFKLGGAFALKQLFKNIREQFPEAVTATTLKLFEAVDIKEFVFTQIEEFTRLNAWWVFRRFAWPDAVSSSPSPELQEPPTDAGSSNPSPEPGPSSTSS